jgi:uncharacterized integral membrane protein
MRLVSILMTILLVVGVLGFVVTNLDARVGVTVWKTHYPDVSLHLVVLLAVVAGVIYAGVIGVYQGTQAWVVNRRLNREIQRLESELNFLRTQPPARRGAESPAGQEAAEPEAAGEGEAAATEEDFVPPSAPVYGNGEDGDPEDDVYTGGRAV